MRKLPLHIRIIIGLVLGIVWAFISSYLGWNQFTIDWIDPFGTIFIRVLKAIAVPLVLLSIISGVSSLTDINKLGKLGLKTLVFYLMSTVLAVGIGLTLVNLVKPGKFVNEEQRVKNRIKYELWVSENPDVPRPKDGRSFLKEQEYQDLVNSTMSEDAMDSLRGVAASSNDRVDQLSQSAEETTSQGPLKFFVDMVPENVFGAFSSNANMLQVIFFALFFGICLAMLPNDKVGGVISFVNGANEVILKMVDIIMKAAPFFVFALLAGVIAKMADTPAQVLQIFKGLGSYSITLLVGLLFMIFVLYPLIVSMFIKKLSYREFLKRISPAQFLAFSTSSSAATLPVTMECVEENMGASKKISSFVLPIGATVNMDGTSMYQAIAVVFLAQLHMVDLTLGQQLTIVLTATLASIGSAAVPSAGLVMMIIVLNSVGLNPAWVAIIFPVDRILDMFRTVVNVTGDATVSTLIAKSEGELNVPDDVPANK
ncbi:glutamate:proton symporter [Marivirga tractuosa]|uniref:Sodium:dicarboxylate symporter n=1 Tax=Marivirga tractuosa (strain ATCC 23168 / DSM 4126 / NBRC 15989 / NCIMB 1408 / VKM B-1430 / H-43) TaxID=643867 RepID=E4TTE3_MARTH|nr:dicarboxylate/amino acid:cation symporter [Marivirga tractuosa]ADR22946.1 sodium:dicarboxylate symporter [Marivirga tractuosa DSM 4126]BDD16380.1 glutamate:proton symporter [Marivirga tractuosa]